MSELDCAGVTTETRIFTIENCLQSTSSEVQYYRRKIHPVGRALWTAKKARGGNMSAPALGCRSVSSERLMLPRIWSTPGALRLEETHPLY